MTESEWLECTDSLKMLWFLDGTPGGGYIPDDLRLRVRGVTGRKWRLFACGCCRRIWSLLTDGASQKAVETAELFADGGCDAEQMDDVDQRAFLVLQVYDWAAGAAYWTLSYDACTAAFTVSEGACDAVQLPAWRGREYPCEVKEFASMSDSDRNAILDSPALNAARIAERERQTFLLRDIFGPLPFRPITIDPRWLTSTVVDLAGAIYQERAFEHMPILADALMDAGCDNEEIIAHCRGDGPHVRGCWVVDLLTGRE